MWLKKEKIVVVITLFVFFLLMINTVPAINQHYDQNSVVKQNVLTAEKIDLKKGVTLQQALLLNLIIKLLHFRFNRGQFLCDISITLDAFGWVTIDHPILFFRGFWLTITAAILLDILNNYTSTHQILTTSS